MIVTTPCSSRAGRNFLATGTARVAIGEPRGNVVVIDAYVDPRTYYPVEIRVDGNITRFSTYEFLPRTAANLALTNIRAQHPHARLTGRR